MFKVFVKKSYTKMEFAFCSYAEATEFMYTILMNRVDTDDDEFLVTIIPVKEGEEA